MHVSFLGLRITINPARKFYIDLLLAKKVTIPVKYLNFADVFLVKLANVVLAQIGANKYAIELEKSKQPPYKPIYSLKPVELKTFKTYIKTNLANGFFQTLKLPADALILFVCKFNDILYLCIYY